MTTPTTPSKKTNCLKAKRARAVARRSDLDLNKDGNIDQAELDAGNQMLELELREEKADTQKRMAWMAMVSMVLFTAVLFLPIFPDEKIKSLADVLDVFYIAQAGIVGAYMGIQAWMSRKSGGSGDGF